MLYEIIKMCRVYIYAQLTQSWGLYFALDETFFSSKYSHTHIYMYLFKYMDGEIAKALNRGNIFFTDFDLGSSP